MAQFDVCANPRAESRAQVPYVVEGHTLVLMPHLSAPVGAKLLRKAVASLRSSSSDICAAMDAVQSGF
jgi:hypothetical protein